MKHIKNILMTILLLCLLLLASCCKEEVPEIDSRDQLIKELDNSFALSKMSGASLVVVDKDGVLINRSFGYADVAAQKEYTSTTLQNIGSVSKTLIAAAIMKAQDNGLLDLDDPINDYLPYKVVHPRHPDVPITLRHLTQHTSGISDDEVYPRAYLLLDQSFDYSDFPKDAREMLDIMKSNERVTMPHFLENMLSKDGRWYTEKSFTKKKPGERYHYSNVGATLAAYVLERAVGMPFDEYTRQEIFAPLGMTDTRWHMDDGLAPQYAKRYLPGDLEIPDYELLTYADGALMTSTADMAPYLQEMLRGGLGDGTLLSSVAYQEMFTRLEFGDESSGVFWGVSKSGVYNHTGSDPGVLSVCAVYPDGGIAAFLMTNTAADEDKNMVKHLSNMWDMITDFEWNK